MIRINNEDPGRNIKYQEDADKRLLSLIDDTDQKMLSYIGRLYEATHSEKLDFDKIKNAVDALQEFNAKNDYSYLNNLLHPESCKGVKIPSQIPIPSCSFQLHNCVTLRTNRSGNLAIIFNPYFLASNIHNKIPANQVESFNYQTNFYSTLFVNNDDSLNGYSPNENWYPINIGQEIPPVYNQYRLVSASLVIKYIGRLDTVSGVIGGAIVFDETHEIGASYDVSAADAAQTFSYIPKNLAKYGNFDLAMDAFYRQENLCLEGIRQLYFPLDNSYEEYTRLMVDELAQREFVVTGDLTKNICKNMVVDESYLKNGFRQMVYVLGAPANHACFKLDIYCNFECLPASPFLNYLPLSMSTNFVSPEMKKEASTIIQQKPIMKSNEGDDKSTPGNGSGPSSGPSIWQRMKAKFMDSLPGIGKLISAGLVTAIPQLQLGTALSNAMALAGNTINAFTK